MNTQLPKPNPGTISISLKHKNGGRITAHYTFPDFEFSECAWDELRRHARGFSALATEGHHACGMRKRGKRREKLDRIFRSATKEKLTGIPDHD